MRTSVSMKGALTGVVTRLNGWRIAAVTLALVLAFATQAPSTIPYSSDLPREVANLAAQLHELQQEQLMPVQVLNRYRDSVCFIYGIYSFTGSDGTIYARRGVSGTGFVVAKGLIATNRHIATPWVDDEESEMLIRGGARPRLDNILAFFPGQHNGIPLVDVRVSREADLAVARVSNIEESELKPLPLSGAAAIPGEPVVVVGYPMGTTAMLAKSPQSAYRRLATGRDRLELTRQLAARSLIRPLATYGHLGDVLEDKLVYDAVTARGGSGGPVFDRRGNVIGVNAAYLDGFSGSTIGIPVKALKPLIEAAEPRH